MEVRDPSLLALSLLILAGSGLLGVLVHDGAVGVDSAAALSADSGDWVRLKGQAAVPEDLPEPIRDALLDHTVQLEMDGLDRIVLVTSMEPLPDDGVWVVDGRVVASMGDPAILVLAAERLRDPVWFK